jgi:hypothetical protein
MTGCPALFAQGDAIPGIQHYDPANVRRIALSIGQNCLTSIRFSAQLTAVATSLRRCFPQATLTAAFHHGIGADYLASAHADPASLKRRQGLRRKLEQMNLECVDVSGSVDRLSAFYDSVDLHIGWRVHAHIYQVSFGRPSLLLAEDARGLSLGEAVTASVIPSFLVRSPSRLLRGLSHFGLGPGYVMNNGLVAQLEATVLDPIRMQNVQAAVRDAIIRHLDTMTEVVRAWP